MYSTLKTSLKKVSEVKVGGIPLWILVLLGGYIYYAAYERGKLNEQFKHIEQVIDSSQRLVESLKDSVQVQLVQIKALQVKVDSAKAKVIVVDRVQIPKIDSALDELTETLDSSQKKALQVVVDGYELRLSARDSTIAALQRLTEKQDTVIAQQSRTIEFQDNLNKTLRDAYKAKKGLSLPAKIAGGILGGAVIYSLIK